MRKQAAGGGLAEIALQHEEVANQGGIECGSRIFQGQRPGRFCGGDDCVLAVRGREDDGEIAGAVGKRNELLLDRFQRQLIANGLGAEIFAHGRDKGSGKASACHDHRLVRPLATEVAGLLATEDRSSGFRHGGHRYGFVDSDVTDDMSMNTGRHGWPSEGNEQCRLFRITIQAP